MACLIAKQMGSPFARNHAFAGGMSSHFRGSSRSLPPPTERLNHPQEQQQIRRPNMSSMGPSTSPPIGRIRYSAAKTPKALRNCRVGESSGEKLHRLIQRSRHTQRNRITPTCCRSRQRVDSGMRFKGEGLTIFWSPSCRVQLGFAG